MIRATNGPVVHISSLELISQMAKIIVTFFGSMGEYLHPLH